MNKIEQLYEGKAKKVYSTEDPNVVIVSYKDDATAFDGLKKGTITGKGAINNRVTNHLMRMLETKGIPTHYVKELSPRETLVKKVTIVPLEVIVRNVAAGSFAKRLGVEEGRQLAEQITYPLIIKAANGGGGRGMRIVRSEDELENAFYSAKSEAKACFGDDDVYMEKYIEHPKHVEVQVLADEFGNVVHLYERDCSFQRRNQKMIEEAPCHVLDEQTRQRMFADAIRACKYVGYTSVGTIEFLLAADGNYYFMEMNTRIQVEHPITEQICGIDIVKYQIRVADHQKLGLKQEDIHANGYALECRINAENIHRDFAPSPGKITFMNLPCGRGVRVETAVYNGYTIPPYYDSMIAKIITFAPTRLECIKKMRIALEELIIDGVETNIEFHYLVLHQRQFIEGTYDTGYAQQFIEELKENGEFI